MVYADLAIKMEMVILDLSYSLWWGTMAEFCVYLFALMIFLTDPSTMSFIWLFFPHLIRGTVALMIIKKMPTSHEMVSNI